MKVQIFEPFAGWHHTKYVALLLPALLALKASGLVSEIILTTTRTHCESDYFADSLAPFSAALTIDMVEADHRSLGGAAVARMLLARVRAIRPDYVVSTSANNGLLPLALASVFDSALSHHGTMSVGVIHNGYAGAVRGIADRMHDRIHRAGRRFAPWSELHVVNPLLYATIERQLRGTGRAVHLLPDPVEAAPSIDRRAARMALGLPLDGRAIGLIGKSDPRKAVPELLAAFRAAPLAPSDRLVLAGSMYAPYASLIADSYADLVATGRIHVIDRYLSASDLRAALAAMNVSAIAYYTDELSGNMLAAIAAGIPVLANATGYAGMIVRDFSVGWSADIHDRVAYAQAIRTALDGSDAYRASVQTRRLLAFHAPQNYADTLLRPLYERLGIETQRTKTWAWVTAAQSLDEDA